MSTTLDQAEAAVADYGLTEHQAGYAEGTAAQQVVIEGLSNQVAQAQQSLATVQAAFDAYKASHPDTTPPPPPPPPVKVLPYAGAAYQGNADPTPMETSAGRVLGMHGTYWNLDQNAAAVSQAKADIAKGRIPSLSFKLPAVGSAKMPWAQAAAGQADAKVKDLATRLAALNAQVDVFFHHEPQGDPDGTSSEYQAFQARFRDIIKPIAPKVKFGICLIAWNTYASGNAAYALAKWMPAGGIDILGYDFYNPYGTKKTPTSAPSTTWTLLSKYADQIAKDAKAAGAVWMIRETGQTDEAFAKDATAMGKDFDTMANNTIQPGYAWCYFNSSLNSTGSWPLSGAKQTAFNTILNRSRKVAT